MSRSGVDARAVTIGLPVYNGAAHLPATLVSLAEQDHEPLEVLISDNGSTDLTEEICRELRDPRFRYVRHDVNRGAAWNYNWCAERTTTPYFKWGAHDDLVLPGLISKCVDAHVAGGRDVVLTYARTMLIDGDGDPIRPYDDRMDLRDADPLVRLSRVFRDLRLCNAVFGVIRLDALRRTSMIQSFPGSDVVVVQQLAALGQFREIPELLFQRRVHAGMSMRANKGSRLAQWFSPSGSTGHRFRRTRLVREMLSALKGSPLDARGRTLARLMVLRYWAPREAKSWLLRR